MTKFLRKYNKWLIAGFGSFLVLTWLVTGPGAFQSDPRKRVVATVAGEKIRAEELGEAELEYAILENIAPGTLKFLAGVENGSHWYLLRREAQAGGFIGEAGDGANWGQELTSIETEWRVRSDPRLGMVAQQILSNPGWRQSQEQETAAAMDFARKRMSGETRKTAAELDMALARLRGVMRMVNTFQYAPRLSDVRMAKAMEKAATQVSFDAVVIPAANAPNPESPKDEMLTSLFDQYKNAAKGTGETGIGYQLPKRIKAEWMVISKAAVEGAVVLDAIDVNKHWLQNRAIFKGEFAAERANVEKALRDARVNEVFAEIERTMRARIRSAARGLEVSGGAKKLSNDWATKRPKMEDLATGLMNDINIIKLPRPVVVVKAADYIPVALFKDADVIAGPDNSGKELAVAQYNVGTESGAIVEFLQQLYEFRGTNSLGLQVGVPFEAPLITSNGDRIYITILDAKVESPAESLEQVRADVTKDAARLMAFEKLKTDQTELVKVAVSGGLEAIAKRFATAGTDLSIDRRILVSRLRGSMNRPELNTQMLRDQLVDHVEAMGLSTRPSSENVAARTLSVPLPSTQSLAIIQITGWRPISIEFMRTADLSAAASVAAMELREVATKGDDNADMEAINPFSLTNMQSRMQFVSLDRATTPATGGSEKKSETTPAPAAK